MNFARTTERTDHIHGRADGAPGKQHIVDDDHGPAVERDRQIRRTRIEAEATVIDAQKTVQSLETEFAAILERPGSTTDAIHAAHRESISAIARGLHYDYPENVHLRDRIPASRRLEAEAGARLASRLDDEAMRLAPSEARRLLPMRSAAADNYTDALDALRGARMSGKEPWLSVGLVKDIAGDVAKKAAGIASKILVR